jgi:hypothetical protein
VALCAEDRAGARAHLMAASSIFGEVESMHQAGWAFAVLTAVSAEDGDADDARGWLKRAIRQFELLGGEAGMAYCEGLKSVQSRG